MDSVVSLEEINAMLSHRPLDWDPDQFQIDYGREVLNQVMIDFQDFPHLLGCLMWPGVGTRFSGFVSFIQSLDKDQVDKMSCLECFQLFANHLGRVVSYRALSLTTEQYDVITEKNTIWPTGRLRTSMEVLESIVNEKGVWYIAHARLYIGRGLVRYDPSLSLHDDPETAVTIASGYTELPHKKIYLMELDFPKIESLGYLLADVQDDDKAWFTFKGVKFCSYWERTERYTLYEIPFYKERLISLRIFSTETDIENFIAPFRASQQQAYNEWKQSNIE
eukprot:TRINITY_DN7298_c0_g1_i1.p1 TRINITY_DN7298_c0_g1~~TRINITY_DN7298_c0_g1_i1.p1  ORF type:complete len:278 (+),score=39.24 TRINITY_DN7298_c0_g1_i1:222-1055(+)